MGRLYGEWPIPCQPQSGEHVAPRVYHSPPSRAGPMRHPPKPRQHRPHQGSRPPHAPAGEGGPPLIFGIHAVEAALANPSRAIAKLYLTDNAERRLQEALANRRMAHDRVLPKDLDRRLGPDTVHQGALVEVEPLPEPSLAELVARGEGRPIIALDQVTDPHNVGAILRSGAAFGAAGLVMTRRHSPPLDGALAKAASGALEHVPVALAQNLARALAELKDLGCLVVGLGCGGPRPAPAHARQLRPPCAHRHRGRDRQPQRLQRRRRRPAPRRHAAARPGAFLTRRP